MPSRRLKAPESACEYTRLQRFHHLRSGNPFFRQPGWSSHPFQGPRRRSFALFYVLHFLLRELFPLSDASTTARTLPPLIHPLHPRILHCRTHVHQRIVL